MAIALGDIGQPLLHHQLAVNVITAGHITLANVPLDVASPLRNGKPINLGSFGCGETSD